MKFENQPVYYQTLKAVLALVLTICTTGFAVGKPHKINLAADNFSDAKYKEHIEQLKKKLPNKEFVIVIQPPFVVVGDEPDATVKQRSEQTVKWAVDKLKASYFTKDPNEILDIWLFKDETSYYKNAKEIFGDEPDTPYGYYSSAHKALVMNIGTGGGTLVHEIVHPFIEANFPDCPAWFNEGLASLYEQSGEVNGKIHGFTNWRLAGLQRAIRNKVNPTFKTLLATTDNEFYADETGVYYAQARYLCYYLQQKNLLVRFYQGFTKNSAKDPSGYKTLQTVLGERDMTKFQKNWETFVLQLRYKE
jgi:hypothetical protein